MAKTITSVSANNTFQVWLDKTNEIVSLINNDVFTASPSGDTTIGNATLLGSLTANTMIANDMLRVKEISPITGLTTVGVSAPVHITTNQVVLERLISTVGPRISLYDNSVDWQVGFENSTNKNFIITSGGSTTFRITSGGNIQASGTVTATSFIGSMTGGVTGNLTGNVTGTVSSLSNHTTTNLAEGTNLYFTTARARSSISASGALSYNSTTGVMSITEAGIRGMFSAGENVTYNSATGSIAVTDTSIRGRLSGGTGVSYNNTTGAISIGQAVETSSAVNFASVTTTGTVTANSLSAATLQGTVVNGSVKSTFTNFGSQSGGVVFTPSLTAENWQFIQNAGNFSISAPTPAANQAVSIVVYIANITGAGIITFSGFGKVVGDATTTTVGQSFYVYITRVGGGVAIANVVAAQ